MQKEICVLTTLMDLPSGYGLVPVILNQLKMLVDNGYEPHLFVQTQYNKRDFAKKLPKGVVLTPKVPFTHLIEYGPSTPKQDFNVDAVGVVEDGSNKTNFDAQVGLLVKGLEPLLSQYEVVITHDILFQTWFVAHNAAIRTIGERYPHLRWIHWLHSGPSPRPLKLQYPGSLRFVGMNNSIFVSPNESMTPKFAEMYNIPRSRLRVVYNTIDLEKLWKMHPLSMQIINKHKLREADILCVWATRIDHLAGKGLVWPVRIVAQLNKIVESKMVFCNSWSRDVRAKNNIKVMRKNADEWGLPQENLIFTSEMGRRWENGVPYSVVADMYHLGNLFIMPSISETFSLAMAEAAACKNFLVLNDDLSVFHELAGDDAMYIEFGSEWGGDTTNQKYNPNPQAYFMARAREIAEVIKNSKPLQMHRRVVQRYNREWVWKNQVKPLIEGI